MNPYIRYEIKGLQGISVIEEDKPIFSVDNDKDIESVELLTEGHSISGIQVNFRECIVIDEKLAAYVAKKVQVYFAKLACEPNAVVDWLQISEAQRNNPNLPPLADSLASKITAEPVEIVLGFSVSNLTVLSPLCKYKALFDSTYDSPTAEKYYLSLSAIKQEANPVTRYLMQYELLKSIIRAKSQRAVTTFLVNKYGQAATDFNPKLRKSNDRKKRYQEDEITYFRNRLVHSSKKSSKELPNDYMETLKRLDRHLIRAINFAIQQLPQEEK